MREPGCDENGVCVDPEAYFFHVIGRRKGDDADDHEAVVTRTMLAHGAQPNVPEGQLPGLDWPFKAIAVMVSGGVPRGRLFLPSNQAQVDPANGNRWFTQDVQYIRRVNPDGGPRPTHVYDWHVLGGVYVPIQTIHGPTGNEGGNGSGGTGLTAEQVQAMIEAAIKPLQAELALAIKVNQTIALQAWGNPQEGRQGKLLCAEDGGPKEDEKAFRLTSRSSPGSWESWRVLPGV